MVRSRGLDDSAHRIAIRLGIFLAVFIGTVGVGFRHIPRIDPEKVFLLKKYNQAADFDIVLLGDSRVLIGLDPSAFENAIPKSRCLNFGFTGVGYTEAYLHRVNQVLSTHTNRRLIVLAIDGPSLTLQFAENNAFTEIDRMSGFERLHLSVLGPRWLAKDPVIRKHRFLDNGWIPVSGFPFEPTESLSLYAKVFETARCSESILNVVSRQIRSWTTKGVKVLALRMPTTKAMFQLECNQIGYQPSHVRDTITAAGASWIELPNSNTDSYDGSHLDQKAAHKASEEIAQAGSRLLGQ